MSTGQQLDEELDLLEKKDIEIRTEMSLIQHRVVMTNIVSTHRDIKQDCDIRKIIDVAKTLH